MEQLPPIGLFLIITAGTVITAIVVNWLFRRFLKRSTLIMRNDPTNYVFLRHALTGLIYVLGFSWAIYSLPNLRAVANSLLAGAGILAVAVGFASQHALSNIIMERICLRFQQEGIKFAFPHRVIVQPSGSEEDQVPQ